MKKDNTNKKSALLYILLGLSWLAGAPASFAQSEDLVNSYREEIVIYHDGPVYLTGDYLRFSVLCLDQSNHLLSPLSRLAYVELLDSENNALAQSIIDLKEGKGQGEILLPFAAASGNYILRAYTRWMRNFSPELYAHTVVSVVNPFKALGLTADAPSASESKYAGATRGLTVEAGKPIYGSREKVSLTVALDDLEGHPLNAMVSVSVSKVPEFAVSADGQFIDLSPVAPEVGPQPAFRATEFFLPETKGQYLTGKVYKAGTREPAGGELIYLSITGVQPEFYVSKSDEQGVINFEIIDFYGSGEIHLQGASPTAEIDIELTPFFSGEFASVQVPALAIDEKWEGYLTGASQNMQIRNVYTNAIPYSSQVELTDTLPFYGIPDQRYFLDDYTRFPLMEEVLREYVSGILLRKRDDGFFFRMVDVDKNEVMPNEPLMLYDGMPVRSANSIVEADPRLVKRIDIITRRYIMGDAIFDGITSFHTYKGDLTGLNEPVRGTDFKFTGVQPNTGFAHPDYDDVTQRDSSLPDFRNTLYWNPQVSVKEGRAVLEFFTGDSPGTFLIEVGGISEQGQLVSQKAYIKVEK